MSTVQQQSAKPQKTHFDQNQFLTTVQNVSLHAEEKHTKARSKRLEHHANERLVEDNPEYFRINNEICHQLYELYRREAVGPETNGRTFDQKEQNSNSLNYHKIMKMFKDAEVRVQINQKLQLLRAIKKFSFNQNFINQAEFNKIYKVMVHGLTVKQTVFRQLVSHKQQVQPKQPHNHFNSRKIHHIKLDKHFAKKIKTQPEMHNENTIAYLSQLMRQNNTLETIIQPQQGSFTRKATWNGSVELGKSTISTARRKEGRKRMVTEVNRYEIGQQRLEGGQEGYFNRAMEKNKLGKLTWQGLFKMKENNLPTNIVIPSFVCDQLQLDDQYML